MSGTVVNKDSWSKSSGNTDNVKALAPHNLHTIEAFKEKVYHPLLPNRYTVYFYPKNTTCYFYKAFNTVSETTGVKPSEYLECKISSISLPNYQIDNEEIYVGGSNVSVPTGLTKGNLDLTIINQGIEYDVIYSWLKQIYNGTTRHYGYFDDIAVNVYVTQYATNGEWVLEHHYYDCTPYNTQLEQLSYDEANSIHTFSLSLNYFSYDCVHNYTAMSRAQQDKLSYAKSGTLNYGKKISIQDLEGKNVEGSKDYNVQTLK